MEEFELPQPEDLAMTPEGVVAVEPEAAALAAELTRLSAALEQAELQATANLAGWQRAQATYENFRKRAEAERVEWTASATLTLLARLLPVLDDFERAFANLSATLQEEPWVSGVQLIEQKLRHILTLEGVEPIPAQPGESFDPFYHQAVLQQEVPGFEEGQIVVEVQRGYRRGERVVRPAQVVVATASAKVEPAETA